MAKETSSKQNSLLSDQWSQVTIYAVLTVKGFFMFRLCFLPHTTFIAVLSLFVALGSVYAIEIDDFDSSAMTLDVPASGVMVSVRSAQVLGGSRSAYAENTVGGDSVTLRVNPATSTLTFSQGVDSIGKALLVWDGAGLPRSSLSDVTTAMMLPVDFTQDGASAVRIVLNSKDLAAVSRIRIHAFEHGSTAGSVYELTLDYVVDPASPVLIDVPFVDFSPAFNFQQVGAVALEILGDNPQVDLSLGWFGTNGSCPSVPFTDTGSVFDLCGECLADPDYIAPTGPLKSCLDCQGIPFGDALPGQSCESGAPGQCSTGLWTEITGSCACVPGNPSMEICDGADNNCNGNTDENFPQLGEICGVDLPNCQVEGVFVCSGDGGIRCDADFDPAELEGCGLVIGCDGVPGSELRFDQCGICGGDGTSCVGCESRSLFELLVKLDGNAKAQEQLVKRVARRLERRVGTQRAAAIASRARSNANVLQVRNWVLSWTLPSVEVTCPQTADNCVEVQSTSTTAEYIENSIQMRRTALSLARRLLAKTGNTNSFKVYRRRATRLHKKSLQLTNEVPVSTQRCF